MSLIAGKYQLIRKLATGGMAEVFLAKAAGPRGFEKTLVLKCILPHLAREPSFVEMFHTEATLAAQLSHPHIVQIFDFGEVGGAYFLAMEYIDGPSLRTLIKGAAAQGLMLPDPFCARFISQACEGLAFAHDVTEPETGAPLGLIHRDISPDNLLLTRQGALKVVDFGIAKATGQSHKTESGVIKGKLSYMSPEQVRARPLDRRADVYALGVVLYELLTAHKPHRSDSEAGLMQSILFEQPLPATHYRPDLPEALLNILARAMAKDREQRYPDCHALQSDLEEFILSVGRPVTAQQVSQLLQQIVPPVPPPPASDVGAGLVQGGASPFQARTAADTVPDAHCSRTRQAPAEPSATDLETVALEGLSARTASPAPTPPPARQPRKGRVSRAASVPRGLATVGAVLFFMGVGLVLGQVMTSKARPDSVMSGASTSAPLPVPMTSALPPVEAPRAAASMENTGGSGSEGLPPSAAPSPPVEAPKAAGSMENTGGSGSEGLPPSAAPSASARPSSRPSKPARTSPRRPPSAVAMGTLDVSVTPYADVFVDGQPRGQTPLDALLVLSVGTHEVVLKNPGFSHDIRRTVEVKEGKSVHITAIFSEGRAE